VWVFFSAYGLGRDKSEKDSQVLVGSESVCVSDFRASAHVVVLGDLNARMGNVILERVVGKYGVPGLNDSGERLLDMYVLTNERSVGNTWFKKKGKSKYTWVRVDGGRVIDRALMDYVVESKRTIGKQLLDANVLRAVVVCLIISC
jgi:hypothetical protein